MLFPCPRLARSSPAPRSLLARASLAPRPRLARPDLAAIFGELGHNTSKPLAPAPQIWTKSQDVDELEQREVKKFFKGQLQRLQRFGKGHEKHQLKFFGRFVNGVVRI